jgi:ribosome maturation factor RimP
MYLDAAKLEDEVAKHLIRFDFDLVDFHVRHAAHEITYRIFIDRLDLAPVTLSDCEKITIPLKLFLTSLGVFDDRAQLEVSSPGLDRVLKRDKDFDRFRGCKVRVRFRTNNSKKTVIGLLADFNADALVIDSIEGEASASQSVSRIDLIEARLVSEV